MRRTTNNLLFLRGAAERANGSLRETRLIRTQPLPIISLVRSKACLLILCSILAPPVSLFCRAAVFNLKVVTDASPDYSDMESMIRSITSKWETAEQKCWAMFYWNHIARRQTAPMMLHGMALTDPIRQFNDYGYTMCSTISGINCSIWDANGLKYRSYFYDWDRGHRYILNLREGESYTRYYHSLGKSGDYYVPNGGKDPEAANIRYHLRGNGVRVFTPALSKNGFQKATHS